MTPEHPGFAAAVRVAKRTLAERIAARAANGQPATTLAAPPGEPLPKRPPDNPDPPDGVAKPWKKPWDK
jgi:hypothetical protein